MLNGPGFSVRMAFPYSHYIALFIKVPDTCLTVLSLICSGTALPGYDEDMRQPTWWQSL